ncbi:hypothetical protein Hanom_Chr03g00181201 [Helianthus anomalus]
MYVVNICADDKGDEHETENRKCPKLGFKVKNVVNITEVFSDVLIYAPCLAIIKDMAFGCGHQVLLFFHILLQTNFKFVAFGSQEQIATVLSMTMLVIQGPIY